MSYLELATFHGRPLVVKALIDAGAQVPRDALRPLSDMQVTDYMIETAEEEQAYAEVARILLDHGASADVKGYDGTDLISAFPLKFYPRIHGVLLGGAR